MTLDNLENAKQSKVKNPPSLSKQNLWRLTRILYVSQFSESFFNSILTGRPGLIPQWMLENDGVMECYEYLKNDHVNPGSIDPPGRVVVFSSPSNYYSQGSFFVDRRLIFF